MSITKSQSGSLIDQTDPKEATPPQRPEPDDGDIATPKSDSPTDDDQPLK